MFLFILSFIIFIWWFDHLCSFSVDLCVFLYSGFLEFFFFNWFFWLVGWREWENLCFRHNYIPLCKKRNERRFSFGFFKFVFYCLFVCLDWKIFFDLFLKYSCVRLVFNHMITSFVFNCPKTRILFSPKFWWHRIWWKNF